MYYTVYKITNLINNKIYIGVHKTKNINDDYMGSGKYLKRAIKKYGIENFRKEILKVFDNAEDMFNMESLLVNEDFIKDKKTYNIKLGGEGGEGGFDYINSNKDESYIKVRKNNGFNSEFKGFKGQHIKMEDEDYKRKHMAKILKSKKKNSLEKFGDEMEVFKTFKGKKHSEEAKKKIGEANSKHQRGPGNSQFGTMWIYNLEKKLSKKIKKDELPKFETQGWLKGRKMKF